MADGGHIPAAHHDLEAMARLRDAYIYVRYGFTDTARAYPLLKEAVQNGDAYTMTDL